MMIYPNDLDYLKPKKNYKFPITTKKVENNQEAYWKSYCNRASLHGVRYLSDTKLKHFEKLIWIIILIFAVLATIWVYKEIALQYQHALITTVENSQFPVFAIDFPSIAICAEHVVNWRKVPVAQKIFLPPNPDKETIDAFIKMVEYLDVMKFDKFERLQGINEVHLELLATVNMSEVIDYLALDCEDLFHSCAWHREQIPCCGIFQMEKTESGLCQSFNSIGSPENRRKAKNDRYYPWHSSKSGESSGLVVELKMSATGLRDSSIGYIQPDAIGVMLKSPVQWSSNLYSVHANTESLFIINPKLTTTDSSVKPLPPKERNCVFGDEIENGYPALAELGYHSGNCRTICHEQFLLKYCNCTMKIFFPSTEQNYQHCTPAALRCMYKHRGIFGNDIQSKEHEFINDIKAGMECNCLINCDAVQYDITVNTFPLANTDSISRISLDFYYQSEVILKYRTKIEYTTIDLIANFGGALGLFLGASILSGVEFIYFLTIGLYVHLKERYIAHGFHLNNYWKLKYFKN